MPKSLYDYVVFIGRMQPPTIAHIETIKYALSISDKVIILFGSSFKARTIKNPWTWEERSNMVSGHFTDEEKERLIFHGIRDHVSDIEWAKQVQTKVNKTISDLVWFTGNGRRIGIIGCKKDVTSYYLNMFPQWEFIEMEHVYGLHATDIRNEYFSKNLFSWHDRDMVNSSVLDFLRKWSQTEDYKILVQEFITINEYKESWKNAPYPPIFVTTDAIVIQSGHVLLIQRKASPGKGLWALPGGFLGQDEFLRDGMIRELREETKLKVPEPVLRGSIKANHVFDQPHRSLRGRTITHAFVIDLPAGPLSKVKGSDDASDARWFPISEIDNMEDKLFEDHYSIIQWGIGCIN